MAVRVLFALGALGMLLFLAGVLHIPITALTAAIAALIAISVGQTFLSGQTKSADKNVCATLVMLIPIAVILIAAVRLPLHDYDGRAFWMLKAKGIAHDHSIDGPFFRGEQIEAPRNDYPLLMPLDASTVMLIGGTLDDRIPRFVFVLVYIAFVLMVAEELGGWGAALLAWIPIVTVAPEGGALSAYCDIALAAFVAAAFFELTRAANPWRFGAWVAFAVLTKREGLPLAIILLVAGAYVFRRRFATALIAPAVAIVALFVWRARIPQGDEENFFTEWPTLFAKLERLPSAIAGFAEHLVTKQWGVFWLAAFVTLAILAWQRRWRELMLPLFVIAAAFAVGVAAYTVTSWVQIDLINSSADRLLMHVVGPALWAMTRSKLPPP